MAIGEESDIENKRRWKRRYGTEKATGEEIWNSKGDRKGDGQSRR
jgi:hypothetical protein